MIDNCFYNNVGPFTLSDIASKLNLEFSGDPNLKIEDIATLDAALPNEISFFHKNKYRNQLNITKAGVVVLKKTEKKKVNFNKEFLFSDDPYLTMAQIASIFYPDCEYPNFSFANSKNNKSISEDCFIHDDSRIGNNCIIGSFVKIGPGVKIGSNCIIGDNVSIYYSVISDNVKIYNGVKKVADQFYGQVFLAPLPYEPGGIGNNLRWISEDVQYETSWDIAESAYTIEKPVPDVSFYDGEGKLKSAAIWASSSSYDYSNLGSDYSFSSGGTLASSKGGPEKDIYY